MRTNGTPNGPAACASSHRQRRKWWTALAVLAVLVVLGTVAALTMPASTMSVADMATPETAAAENGQAADAPARDPNATAPAENTPDETTPAATPAPATPESAAPAEAEYTAALGEGADALNVVVTAPAGAFDEGVEPVLQVTALESEQDLQAIAAELDGHEVAYDGFAALDITFTDAQGQEIEPKLPVKVRMELPQAVVDSGIDLTTLTVQHLAEDDQGNVTSVDQVASVAGNTITLSDAAAAAVNEAAGIATMSINALTAESTEAPVVAEFEVDGFSSFVITWDKYFEITVHYVNESGEDINGTSKKVTIKKDESIYFADLAETTVNGLEYKRAAYSEDKRYDDSDKTVTHITADSGTIFGSGARWVEFYNETETVKTIYQGNFGGWGTGTQKADVYLVYGEPDQGGDNPGGGDSGSTEANVTVGKSAVLDQETGNYTLELSVTGDRGSVSNKQKLDVLFILDESNSMGDTWGWEKRIDAAKSAIQRITGEGNNVGLSDDNRLDVQYALVGFGGGTSSGSSGKRDDAGIEQSWTSDPSEISNKIPNIVHSNWGSTNRYGGGTNYEAGFDKGNDALAASTRNDALKVVIFISDGTPGYYYGADGKTDGTGQPDAYDKDEYWTDEYKAVQNAITELKTMDIDYFYFVGVGTNTIDKDVYTDITGAAPVQPSNRDSVTGNDADDLVEKFDDIKEQLVFFAANNVSMTDPLSQYADLVKDENGKYNFTVSLQHRTDSSDDYTTVDSENVSIAANAQSQTIQLTDGSETVPLTVEVIVDADGKETIQVDFDNSYQLAKDYRYLVSTTIKASQDAIDVANDELDGTDSPENNNEPDSNTGTHANGEDTGFWSNDNENAKVTMDAIREEDGKVTVTEADKTVNFPKPVIQATADPQTADLTIVKKIYGLSQRQVVDLVNGEYQTPCDKGDHTHGLRFDVDYFGNEEDAKNDNWDNESDPTSTFIDDWTFDVKQTLDANDEFVSNASDTEWSGDIQEPVDLDTPDDKEGDSYMSSSLTYVANTGEEPYYRYTITIKDAKLEDWYHVWETNTEVTGYDLEASVKAVNADGEDIENIAENTHDNKATAFQLTGDTTVTFTNRYTHSPVTVNFKKVDATYHEQGLAGAQFKLFYTENNTNHYYTENGTSGANWDATEDTATSIASENDGTLTLPALEVGRTYYLTEVTAPDGYQLLTQNIKIVVNENGDIKVTYADGSTLPENTENKDINLIPNTTGTELPETGGRGTNFLTIGGLLIMAAAAGGYVLRRRRGKEAR